MLQTGDFYCKLYSYLIKAPLIWENINNGRSNVIINIYNYNMDPISKIYGSDNFEKFNKDLKYDKIDLDKDKIQYIREITFNTDPTRIYYNKYLKYKSKYINILKNKINS
jgi:hypothetical protein